ncbi:FtsW/RodA/SpoVE family cell cycle protein [Fructobacillus fructosus]|uniref:Peptodoglycan polymerase FtsW/RodA/SpoVE (FtsW) n=1 Tax=Fructobacillus fructosus TaxID=1631 RepID=A0ABM9N129_9LACO|nr:FtsW/RodA/SpoVE family cell cycle protein [Fructobacillus fructosus]MBD9366498.1 FtsW/RodA/SpoVE family cell cycle protein [Leuconostoc mesenteroides]MBC9119267.1 FtsW/RodA/SpoVE family cell cycle protein [Fructobacillus fructosus]MCK8638891.1 FtsW/RodA/SpoVE family cell cycle protein [Fructobacillus fructosus]CAK1247443.1 Peptodoglycan polymerase FtsW/RodA/SpoVE (FtsW) [Fructobacillus fructosus]CAK1253358.1 Peptodoglycan polymerase FtsW/RodA/SpoVE (FtsW) [Fructobacillus fructosus]
MQRRAAHQSNRTSASELDWGMILVLILLMLIGLYSLYFAILNGGKDASPLRAIIMQLLYWAVGGVMIAFIMRFDAFQLWRLAPIAYGLGIVLLIGVLFFYNRALAASAGAKSWIAFGPVSLQPSEVVKPAFILMLSKVVANHNRLYPEHTTDSDWLLIGKMVGVFLPIALLIALQNDLGTLLVFIAILGGITIVSGVTWRILGPILIAAGTLGGGMLFLVTSSIGRSILGAFGFQAYQFARIDAWLHPGQDTSDTGYQTYQNLKAIGSGQLFGSGFGNMKVFVPVRESDMIFSVMGESFGFVGGAFLIAVYFLLLYLMIRVTFKVRNSFYAYIATGVVVMVLFHVFENIGMNIGLLPLTGIPLPFISQGGSSLLSNMIGVGLVMSMSYQQQSRTFNESNDFSL